MQYTPYHGKLRACRYHSRLVALVIRDENRLFAKTAIAVGEIVLILLVNILLTEDFYQALTIDDEDTDFADLEFCRLLDPDDLLVIVDRLHTIAVNPQGKICTGGHRGGGKALHLEHLIVQILARASRNGKVAVGHLYILHHGWLCEKYREQKTCQNKKSFDSLIVDKEKYRQQRVAAYCRVSTDSEEQLTSYTTQKKVYTEMIAARTDWEFAGLYADEGISGTRADKRPEFKKMINDCLSGKIDYIITKSVSRFARNTVDCLDHAPDRRIP